MLHYINKYWCPPHAGNWLDVYNPAYGKVYSQLASGKKHEVDMAVAAAKRRRKVGDPPHKMKGAGSSTPWQMALKRGLMNLPLQKVLDGKPLWLTKAMDIPRAIANLQFFGHAITQFSSEAHETSRYKSSTIHFGNPLV